MFSPGENGKSLSITIPKLGDNCKFFVKAKVDKNEVSLNEYAFNIGVYNFQ